MRKPEEGERVLVEGKACRSYPDGTVDIFVKETGQRLEEAPFRILHPHPGVPVEDLLEELELTAARMNSVQSRFTIRDNDRYWQLRRAREAAQRPKFEPGQRVWVRGRVATGLSGCTDNPTVYIGGIYAANIHPDDIKTREGD